MKVVRFQLGKLSGHVETHVGIVKREEEHAVWVDHADGVTLSLVNRSDILETFDVEVAEEVEA